MITYPLISDYDLAVSRLDKFVKAPQFSGGSPVLRQNQIFAYSGGYSVVYPINVNGKKMALRCWIKEPGHHVKERYARVKSYLVSNPTTYFVDFGYVDTGIVAKGITYPVIYMDWIDGKTFSQFIDENISNPTVINQLAEKFVIMVRDLHSKNIAHGDLQDGNIIVCKNTHAFDLRLVDYDSLYTPTLQGWQNPDDLMGVPDYQHPKRHKKANEKADYFSELVIYLSLLAYAEKPSLWKKGQEKRLLFTEKDFQNPASSPTFQLLQTLSPKIKHLANELRKFCTINDTNQLVPLEQILTGTGGSATTSHPSTTASLDSFFGSAPTTSTKPSYQPVSSAPSSSSDFSSFFGSSPAQPVPKNIPSTQPYSPLISSSQPHNFSWQGLVNWFSVSSHLATRPFGFWKSIFISAILSGLVTWAIQELSLPSEFYVFTLLFLLTPLSYLLTKNKMSIFFSLLGIAVFDYMLYYFGEWTEITILSLMAIAGAIGFSGISSYRISFVRILIATSLSSLAFIITISLLEGAFYSSDFVALFLVLGAVFTSAILSVIATKILGRG